MPVSNTDVLCGDLELKYLGSSHFEGPRELGLFTNCSHSVGVPAALEDWHTP